MLILAIGSYRQLVESIQAWVGGQAPLTGSWAMQLLLMQGLYSRLKENGPHRFTGSELFEELGRVSWSR